MNGSNKKHKKLFGLRLERLEKCFIYRREYK